MSRNDAGLRERSPEPQGPDPRTVLDDPRQTREQKIEQLRSWSYDARRLEIANEEGMGGSLRSSDLAAIQAALRELGAADDATLHAP